MVNISASDSRFLNELVKDCIVYRLVESEALEYIKQRYGKKISLGAYKQRKAHVRSDLSTQLWLNHFTRVGFVKSHIGHLDSINKIRDDSMRQLQIEQSKKTRNESKILRLKDSVMEATKLLVGLDMGTPIISAIKTKLEQKDSATAVLPEDKKKKKKKELSEC